MEELKRGREINPFPNGLLFILDSVCLWFLKLFRLPLDAFLSSFGPTTTERKNRAKWISKRILMTPLICVLMLATLPSAILAFLIWLTFQQKKTPYRISVSHDYNECQQIDCDKETFTFATTNLCLLQQCLSRFNNQTDPSGRSRKQGMRIAQQQAQVHSLLQKNINSQNNYKSLASNDVNYKNNCGEEPMHVNGAVLEEFPAVDILLIQEAWVKEYAEALANELHAVFPYIVYDAGYNTWKTNCFLGNSGQMIASRYPIIEVGFDAYRSKCSQCRLASKGLLQIKVLVKETTTHRLVGYAYTTHLQAYQGTRPIHTDQLDQLCEWTTRFRRRTLRPNEIVVFDVLGGDFNLDNSSPVDREDWSHPVFDLYHDLGRVRPGLNHPWAVGTEMRHSPLHDKSLQTPAGLKRALEDPLLLQYYVLDGNQEDLAYRVAWEMPAVDEEGRQQWHRTGGKRRIDYIMQRQSDTHVESISLNPVSQMAGLTDHIPYALTVHVPDLQRLTATANHVL